MAKLLKFGKPNCRGCTVIENVINEVEPDIEIISYDIVEKPELVDHYELTGVPTMIIIDDKGYELAQHVGTMTEDEFSEWIELYKNKPNIEVLWEVVDNG